jgi:hypothetical protein
MRLTSLDQPINTFEPCVNGINVVLGYKEQDITFYSAVRLDIGIVLRSAPAPPRSASFCQHASPKVWGAGSWSNVDKDQSHLNHSYSWL